MKSLILLALCCVTCTTAFTQSRNVTLVINQKLGGKPFAFDMPVQSSGGAYLYELTRLQYYVSGIQLVHDGGQVTSIPDLYLLIDPSDYNRYALGTPAVLQIEGIRFNIGVDSLHNHLDPATYPFSHPLALQDPSMHWGWAAGYRFVALEGYAGPSAEMLTTNFQLHTVGDELYTAVALTTSATTEGNDIVVLIDAEYANALSGIDVSLGPINHSNEGEAKTSIQNFGSLVFSPATPSGVDLLIASDTYLHAYPNPANDRIIIESLLPDNTRVVITDMLGREVAHGNLVSGRATMSVSSLPAGSYTAVASDNNRLQSIRVSVAP